MIISAALATFNEEENLDQCLKSVFGWVEEIVIVDGGSTDSTTKIAQKYNARIISASNPAIFHINKQKAIEQCRGTWILQLDADEVITPDLQKEIASIILDKKNIHAGFYIPRRNYFLGGWMKKGGLYPDYVIRLFKNTLGRFPCKSVHEQILIDGSVGYIQNAMVHNTAPTMQSYWLKAKRYISLRADEMQKAALPRDIPTALLHLFVIPIKLFINLIARHKGILDGWRGIVFAFLSALQIPLAYLEYRNRNQMQH